MTKTEWKSKDSGANISMDFHSIQTHYMLAIYFRIQLVRSKLQMAPKSRKSCRDLTNGLTQQNMTMEHKIKS